MRNLNLDLSGYKILIVEDSPEFQHLISQGLGNSLNHTYVTHVKAAYEAYRPDLFDCIIVDISLPDGTGFDFLKAIGSISCPILIISSSVDLGNKMLGFSMGIQDYIQKPFDPIELSIRVSSKIDFFKKKQGKEEIKTIGNLLIDLQRRSIAITDSFQTTKINCSQKEFSLLLYFASNIERVLSRDKLLDVVWGNDNFVSERSVDSAVANLRKKIDLWNYEIKTIYGAGYQTVHKSQEKPSVEYDQSLLTIFAEESQKQILGLKNSINEEDWEQCVKTIHKLKGSFAIFTNSLSGLADMIEKQNQPHSQQIIMIKEFYQKAANTRKNITQNNRKKAS